MEVLNEVVLRIAYGARGDLVLKVKNLPKHFLYAEGPKMVPETDSGGRYTRYLVPSVKQKEMQLKEGIKRTSEGHYLFDRSNNPSKICLDLIENYINHILPITQPRPQFIPYSEMVGNPHSNPIRMEQVPIVELPAPEPEVKPETPPPAVAKAAESKATPVQHSESKADAMKARLAKARAAKRKKAVK